MPSILDLAVAANAVYEQDIMSVGPWTRLAVSGNDSWGFFAGIYSHRNNRDITVAFRGTDDVVDGAEDFGIFLGRYPNQAHQASVVLNTWRAQHGRRRHIFLTGHSLGGGLASLMAEATDLPCVTFNAPGMARSSIPAWIPGNIANVLALGRAVISPEEHILHIRANYDVVSIGTGPRLGIVHSLPLTCPAPRQSVGGAILGAVAPGYSTVRNLTNAGEFVLCQHSMDNVVTALRGNRRYATEVNFASYH